MRLPSMTMLLLSLGLLACMANPVTDRPQLMLVSEEEIIAGSSIAYAEMLETAAYRHALNTDRVMVERVRGIAFRIIPQAVVYRPAIAGWQWDVNVFQSDLPNAFCMTGGKIGVNAGLLAKLDISDDELAQVLGHEIAHALSGHGRERLSTARASSTVIRALVFSPRINNITSTVLKDLADVGIKLPNSRLAELEADKVGMLIAAKAGYDPRAAISLWQKIGVRQVEESISLLSTHPLPGERIAALRGEAGRLVPVYRETAQRGGQAEH